MKVSGYNFHQSLQNLKRLNRVCENFYDFDTDNCNVSLLEDPKEVTEKLLNKYSPLTTLKSIEFIIAFLKNAGSEERLVEIYSEHLGDLMDMRHNPQAYSKMASLAPLRQAVANKYTEYMGTTRSYSAFRNYLVLCLVTFELPLKAHQLLSIEFYKDPSAEQTLVGDIILGFSSVENTFTFYINERKKKKLVGQQVHVVKNNLVHSVFLKYISNYKLNNSLYFISASTGAELSKSNISNCVLNLTNKILNTQLTLQQIRNLFLGSNNC